MAFADKAFKSPSIQVSVDIFKLEVLDYKNSSFIQWRQDILDCPVYHRMESDGSISMIQALPFKQFNDSIKCMAYYTGFPGTMTLYSIQRGTANAVDCQEVTEAQCNLIRGQSESDVF